MKDKLIKCGWFAVVGKYNLFRNYQYDLELDTVRKRLHIKNTITDRWIFEGFYDTEDDLVTIERLLGI